MRRLSVFLLFNPFGKYYAWPQKELFSVGRSSSSAGGAENRCWKGDKSRTLGRVVMAVQAARKGANIRTLPLGHGND